MTLAFQALRVTRGRSGGEGETVLRTISLLAIWAGLGCATGTSVADGPGHRGARPGEPTWAALGSYSTAFDATQPDRSHNIAKAAALLDGRTIPPGGKLSFNRAVGRRTLGAGWRMAPTLAFDGAEPAPGGGICQVSSTLYNAVLLADLRVTRRHPHSRPIWYVPLGRDATVDYGAKDLRFENPHGFPVRLRAQVRGNRLLVSVLAPMALPYEVRLVTGDAEPASPRREFQRHDQPDDLAVGGVWVKLYRQRVRDGSVVQVERIGRASFYPFKRRTAVP